MPQTKKNTTGKGGKAQKPAPTNAAAAKKKSTAAATSKRKIPAAAKAPKVFKAPKSAKAKPVFAPEAPMDKELDSPYPVGKRERPPNFTPQEVVFLVKAYINVTLDSEHGVDQAGNAYWQKIKDTYTLQFKKDFSLSPYADKRTPRKLQLKIGRISRDVQLFGKYYKESKKVYHTGWGDKEYIYNALDLFKEEQGRNYKFEEVTVLMHEIPKFRPSDQDPTDVKGTNNIRPAMGAGIAHPQGQKAAKAGKVKEEEVAKPVDRAASTDRMAQASERMSTELGRKTRHDTKMALYEGYLFKIGDADKAKAIPAKIETDLKNQKEEDELAKKPAAKEEIVLSSDDVKEEEDDTSVGPTESGLKASAKEKATVENNDHEDDADNVDEEMAEINENINGIVEEMGQDPNFATRG